MKLQISRMSFTLKRLSLILLAFMCETNCFSQLQNKGLQLYLQYGHKSSLNKLAFDSTGINLYSLDLSGELITWNFYQQKEIKRETHLNGSDFFKKYRALSSDSKGLSLTINRNRRKISIHNQRQDVVHSFYSESGKIDTAALNANQTWIAWYSEINPFLFYLSTNSFQVKNVIKLNGIPTAVAFHPLNTSVIAVGLSNGSIDVLDLKKGTLMFSLNSTMFDSKFLKHDGAKVRDIIQGASSFFLQDTSDLSFEFLNLKQNPDSNFTYTPKDNFPYALSGYYWDDFKIYRRFPNNKAQKVRSQYMLSLYYNLLEPVSRVSVVFNPSAYLDFFSRASEYFKPKTFYPQLNISNNNHLFISRINTIIEYEAEKFKKVRSYAVIGRGIIKFATSPEFLAAKRNHDRFSDYLSIYSLDKPKLKPLIKLSQKKINKLFFLSNTNLLICQFESHFSIFEININNNSIDIKNTYSDVQGTFLDNNMKKFLFTRSNKLFELSGSEKELTTIRKSAIPLYFKQLNGNSNYCLFYNEGISDCLNADFNLLSTIYHFKSGEYLIISPDNFFNISSKSLYPKLLLKDTAENMYSLDQFENIYNRPDILYKRIGLDHNIRSNLYKLAVSKNKMKMISDTTFEFPTSQIININDVFFVNDSTASVHFRFTSPSIPLSHINISINNDAIFGKNGFSLDGKNRSVFDTILIIKLKNGRNQLLPVCFDAKNRRSLTSTYTINANYSNKPRVYFLGVGIDNYMKKEYKLNYARIDIKNICTALSKRYADNLSVDTLFDSQVTRENLNIELGKYERLRPNDIFIYYYSGHGVLDDSLNLFLSTYSIDFAKPALNGFAYNSLESQLNRIPTSNKIAFLDACHSGGLEKKLYAYSENNMLHTEGKRGLDIVNLIDSSSYNDEESYFLMNELFSDFTDPGSLIVISAARGSQYALEGSTFGNGLFTSCLISGLTDLRADLDNDKRISVSELKKYLYYMVPLISNKHQTPVFRKGNIDNDWFIW